MPDVNLTIKGKNLSKEALQQLRRDVDSTNQSLQGAEVAVEKLGKEGKKTKANLASLTMVSGALAASLGLVIKSVISAAVTLEKQKKGLIAVAGSAAEAEKQLLALREVAKLPGLGLQEALQGSISLQAVGFSAKEAEGALMSFGNALATVGKGRAELSGVILALTQMRAKGKVLAEEINQIAERVPQIRKVMMEAFGTGASEDIQKMGVTAERFIEVVIKELGKLPPVSGGAANAIENLSDSMTELKASLGDVLLPAFTKLLNAIASLVGWMNKLSETQKAVISWSTLISAGLASVAASALGIAMIWPQIIAGVSTLGIALSALVNPITAVVAGIAVLTGIVSSYVLITRRAAKVTKDELITSLEDLGRMTDKQRELEVKARKARQESIKELLEGLHKTEQWYEGLLGTLDSLSQKTIAGLGRLEKQYGVVRKEIIELQKEYERLAGEITKVQDIEAPVAKAIIELTKEEMALERELARGQINRIKDRYQKERELAAAEAKWKIEDYKKELAAVEKVGGMKNKVALLVRAIEEVNADLAHKNNEIAKAEEEELAKGRVEHAQTLLDYVNKIRQAEVDRVEQVKSAEAELIGARFVTERLRISQMESGLKKDIALINLRYDEEEARIRQRLKTEEVSVELMTELYRQLYRLQKLKGMEIQNLQKAVADEKLQGELEFAGRVAKLREKEYAREVALKEKRLQDARELKQEIEALVWKLNEEKKKASDKEEKQRQKLLQSLTSDEMRYYRLLTGYTGDFASMNKTALAWVKKEWDTAGYDIRSGWLAIITDMSEKTLNWKNIFEDVIRTITDHFSEALLHMFDDTQDFADVWKEFRVGMRSIFKDIIAGVIETHAVVLATGLKDIAVYTAKAAAATYSAIAGIPVVGPVLAPIAAAATVAGVAKLTKGLLEFKEGGIISGGLLPVAPAKFDSFQEGGIVRKPTLAYIGEGTEDEAVIPLKHGKVPVELLGKSREVYVENINVTASFPNASLENIDQSRLDAIFRKKFVAAIKDAVGTGDFNEVLI